MDHRTLEEKYKSLPPEVRAAMDSVEVAKKILAIGEKYALHIDKIEELSNETSLVMLGVTPSEKYKERLINVLEITGETAQKIIVDINNEVLYPIRGFLKKNYETPPPIEGVNEVLDREELLKAIESPGVVGSIEVGSIKYKELSIPAKGGSASGGKEEEKPVLGIAEQKMSGAFKIENSNTVETDKSIAAIKKVDPYREAIL